MTPIPFCPLHCKYCQGTFLPVSNQWESAVQCPHCSGQMQVGECVPALPEELRETVFANACDIILADGVVEGEEKALLEKLQKKLELSGDEAMDIVKVMVIKNRG